jgi:hypothetical protein
MKKKNKHYAKQAGLPGLPQPVMGRPASGRALRAFYITEFHSAIINGMADLEGLPPSRWLEAMVEQAALIKH